jgi:RNA polymerase sigma-70 factor, ECF subfamily
MQQHCKKDDFLKKVEACRGIIHKVTTLYADRREDREDLFQEILYQSCRSFRNFRAESDFSTWLYRVALNTALVFKRNEQKHKTLLVEDGMVAVAAEEIKYDHKKVALIDAIKSLAKVERMIITLHLEGYTNQEIADIAGISKENSAVKIHRIKNLLTKKLKEEK